MTDAGSQVVGKMPKVSAIDGLTNMFHVESKIDLMPPVDWRAYLTARPGEKKSFENIFLTFRGRDAINCAVKHADLTSDQVVLLPAYLCDAVMGAFNRRCQFRFYDINEDFSIDTESISNIISDGRIDVLYIIHYFGILHTNLPQLSQICKDNGILLWEDHAHSALSAFSYEYADAMFFSFRKVLPIPDGGGVWLRGASNGKAYSDKIFFPNVMSMLILLKRSFWGLSSRLRESAHNMAKKNSDAMKKGDLDLSVKPISKFSERIIFSADIKKIYTIRRNLYEKWGDMIMNSKFKAVFDDLDQATCPLGFPIWVKNPIELQHKMEQHNIFLKIHWPLAPEVAKANTTAKRISQTIITLPIYPGLKEKDLHRVFIYLTKYGKKLS